MNKNQKKKWDKLLDKIDWEGGIIHYILIYDGATAFKDYPFYREAQRFEEAYKDLLLVMDSNGYYERNEY